MKLFRTLRAGSTPSTSDPGIGRRGLVAGVGIAGVAAVAATALQGARTEAPAAGADAATAPPGDGYRLTDHVLRYYETTKA